MYLQPVFIGAILGIRRSECVQSHEQVPFLLYRFAKRLCRADLSPLDAERRNQPVHEPLVEQTFRGRHCADRPCDHAAVSSHRRARSRLNVLLVYGGPHGLPQRLS